MAASPAILNFFDPEAIWPPLHYGDSVALIPDGVNGLAAFSGAKDGRPWVEELREGASLPPNLRDCHFRLLPRGQFTEVKNLTKMLREGLWDGGRNLPVPEAPKSGTDLDQAAQEYAKKHGLADERGLIKELLTRVQLAKEEQEGTLSERARLQGLAIHYLDTVELQHVTTGKTLNLTKQQAHERAAKKVMFDDTGSETSVFVMRPAFKAYAAGEQVGSGDLVVFQTLKRVGGLAYSLHMGTDHGQDVSTVLKRGLQVQNPVVVNVHEINATTGDQRPTAWRVVMFEPYQHNPLNAIRFKQHAQRFRAEQIVCFYHKEGEAYLDYRADLGVKPVFRESNRVSVKSRKKASWMWKIESLRVFNAGGHVVVSENISYRIKHIVTNLYLVDRGGSLEMTSDYLAAGTLFNFRPFAKDAKEDFVHNLGLVYVRTSDGASLMQVPRVEDHESKHGKEEMTKLNPDMPGMEPFKEFFVGLNHAEILSERDALMIMPVLPGSIASVIQIRRAMLVLKDFSELLESVAIVPTTDEFHGLASPPGTPRPAPGPIPERLGEEAQTVLRYTANCHDAVLTTLTLLVMNSTFDEDSNPLSRDGVPNRLMQKLLRELEAIQVVIKLLQLPFSRGIDLEWMVSGDERFSQLVELFTLCYRLLKQIVKEDDRNATELHKHVAVIRAHQGQGLGATVTLKEMYLGKRKLLSLIQPDLVELFTSLLHEQRDPRYIDFLMSCCTCGVEPMPQIQKMICDGLFSKSPELLPFIKVEESKAAAAETRLLITLPGMVDKHGKNVVIDAAMYNDRHQVRGRDMASHILTADVSEIDATQKTFRYFIRCSNLFGKVSLGRNQTALKFLLQNPNLDFRYEQLLAVLKEKSLPSLTRSRFTTLMIRLYVDRDPQSSKPQVLYTRTWSKVIAEESDLERTVAAGSALPVCTTGFVDLCEHVLEALVDVAGARDKQGKKNLNGSPTFGQLELAAAEVQLCDLLVDFGFYTNQRDAEIGSVDFSQVKQLLSAVFSMVDTRGTIPSKSTRREAMMLVALRSEALKLLIRMLNLRANHRITVMLSAWEEIFEDLTSDATKASRIAAAKATLGKEEDSKMSFSMTFGGSTGDMDGFILANYHKVLADKFAPYRDIFDETLKKCYSQQIVSSEELRADTYTPGQFKGDPIVEAMTNLMGFEDSTLTGQACALLLRHMAQRTRVCEDLKLVQILVYPAAVKVYHETEHAIKALTALKKHLFADKPEAYAEAEALMKRLTTYITHSDKNLSEIVEKNQRIMLNRELDEPVVDLLRLNLERDLTRRLTIVEDSEKDADPPMNPQRRDLFQSCYDFLLALCKNNTQAQIKLFPLIGVFSDHVGFEKLNVADTLAEIVRDNPRLIAQVPESLFSHFLQAILTWGRKARWLRFFEAFLEIGEQPFKRNQDLLLRLVMDNFEELIDLACDYTKSRFLPKTDPRTGRRRLDLIREGDHRWKVRSLVKYHYSSVNTLALCAAGKNAVCQARLMAYVRMDTIVDQIISVPLHPDGKREAVGGDFDWDGVYYVRKAWTKLMLNVYITSLDTRSISSIQNARRLWVWRAGNGGRPHEPGAIDLGKEAEGSSLMGEFALDITTLASRLKALPGPPPEGVVAGIRDVVGWDLGIHMEYVVEVLKLLSKLFPRPDLFDSSDEAHMSVASELRETISLLYYQVKRCKRVKDSMLIIEVLASMTDRGVKGVTLALGEDEEEEEPAEKTKEVQFADGWRDFKLHISHEFLRVDPEEGKTMIRSIKDVAMMLGSSTSFRNNHFQALGEFIGQLKEDKCDRLVQLNGLKVVRAILYLQPDRKGWSPEFREEEYERMLRNDPPSDEDTGAVEFVKMQELVSSLGGVDLVVTCMGAQEKDTVMATLMLSVAMLGGGNKAVQDRFAEILGPASSQKFFIQLHQVMEDGITALKDQKKKIKQRAAENLAMANAGLKKKNVGALPSLGAALKYMTEVMKMMRRMCMGQHKALQDILRKQRLNKISYNFFDEAVNYLVTLEPEIKTALKNSDGVTVEGAIRGFLMLADAMRGPNSANQHSIASNALFDLVDRFMVKMHFELPPEGAEKDETRWRNTMKSRLKTACTICLVAFLEGVEGNAIPNHLLTTVQWTAIASQMEACIKCMEKGGRYMDTTLLYEEGIGYYFILKFLKHYDDEHQYIVPAWRPHIKAVRYFAQRTGYVEIDRDHRLERVFFALPQSCIPGGPLDKPFSEMYDADRGDADKKNQMYLDNMIRLIERENHHSQIRASWLAFTVTRWDNICTASFCLSLLIHIVLVLGAYVPFWQRPKFDLHMAAHETLSEADVFFTTTLQPILDIVAWVLCGLLSATVVVRFVSFVHAELPNIIRVGVEEEEVDEAEADDDHTLEEEEGGEEVEEVELFAATKTLVLHVQADVDAFAALPEDEKFEAAENAVRSRTKVLRVVLMSNWFWYEVLMLLTMAFAMGLREPSFAFWPLFEMCFWKGSRTVIDAIKFNAGKMVQTFMLGLLVMYIFMLFGIWIFYDNHQDEHCMNMFQCFVSYFFMVMRGDGLKDVSATPEFSHNIADFASQGNMLLRTIWDMSFLFIFLYVLIAIITGIVIDAFGGLRDERDAAEDDLQTTCFVCNLDRFTLDQKGSGFDPHILHEHNPRWYFFFLLHVKSRPKSKLTGQEAYVLEKVWPTDPRHSRSYHWFPRSKTLSLVEEEDVEDVAGRVIARVEELEARVGTTESKMLSAISDLQNAVNTITGARGHSAERNHAPGRTRSQSQSPHVLALPARSPIEVSLSVSPAVDVEPPLNA